MILAISRFRVANDFEKAVADAFGQRVGLVDDQPGFLSLEVFTDASDPKLFYLVTRWTDEEQFHAWHAGPAHRESHRLMPRGLKLDKAYTLLSVMERIPSGWRAGPIEPAVSDAAPVLANFLVDSRHFAFLQASADGRITLCNAAAEQWFGAVGEQVWKRLGRQQATALQARLAAAERNPDRPFVLVLTDSADRPCRLRCRIDPRPDGFLLVGERDAGGD